jgi:hypothetical protein
MERRYLFVLWLIGNFSRPACGRRTANVAAQYSSANTQTEGFDASSRRTDRITLMVTTKLLDVMRRYWSKY